MQRKRDRRGAGAVGLLLVSLLLAACSGSETPGRNDAQDLQEKDLAAPTSDAVGAPDELTCPECPPNFQCLAGQCVCVPDCGERVCGDDGCGGNCGFCPPAESCDDGQCTPPPDCPPGDTCDDGNACTVDDVCGADGCSGTPVVCDDGLECTKDVCDGNGACSATLQPGWCLIDEACFPGGTVHPDNPCLECIWSYAVDQWLPADDQPCDDGDPCTLADHCQEGVCTASQTVNCSDDDACTTDSCLPDGGCLNEPHTDGCDDGDACTTDDVCGADGTCHGTEVSCDDSNQCTADTCLPETGCVHTAISGSCSDNNACTVGDSCQDGFCSAGTSALFCGDQNPCTLDLCHPQSGCVNEPLDIACDDGSACTVGDWCQNGTCLPGPAPDCDDGNLCTDDVCLDILGCTHTNNQAPCDDSNPCTLDDKCSNGKCMAGAGQLDCDDGDDCTSDFCNPILGCVTMANSAPCDDENECTVNDTCQAGKCTGTIRQCDDKNVCTTDTCNPFVAGGCVHKANALACDDGDPCSLGDQCLAGECVSGNGKPACDDANPCTKDSCAPKAGCLHMDIVALCDDGNACTEGDYCSGGQCLGGADICSCESNQDCLPYDDGNLCNGTLMCDMSSPNPKDWSCVAKPDSAVACDHSQDTPCLVAKCIPYTGQCQMKPANEGGACDDGNQCTVNDHCASGSCLGGGAVQCGDDNPCTTDSCNPQVGCMHKPLADKTPCQSGGWLCQAGQCLPCTPDCDGKACGGDGCSGSCGSCDENQVCDDGLCVEVGIMSCLGPGMPSYSTCGEIDEQGCCHDGKAILCLFGQLYCVDCPGLGMACGWNEDADSYECLPDGGPAPNDDPPMACPGCVPPCPAGHDCIDQECIACQPQCAGKECGGDGCGGSCGQCAPDEECQAGLCVVPGLLTECKGGLTPSLETCSGIDYIGCCDSEGRVLWCDGGQLYCIDCAADNPQCGWAAAAGFYDCGTTGGTDPSGEHPKACAECIPPCFPGTQCVGGECVACVPNCWGKECGDDNCGGLCGSCPAGTACTNGECLTISQCGDVDESGECDGNTVVWCQDGQLKQHPCPAGQVCAYIPDLGHFGCKSAGCPDIPDEGQCEGDVLVTCGLQGKEELDCAAFGMVCDWDDDSGEYGCVSECGDIDWQGQCDGNVLTYCDAPYGYGGTLVVVDCEETGQICEYMGFWSGYGCVDPCEGVSAFGTCEGNTLIFCDTDQSPPAIVQIDCANQDEQCSLVDPVSGYDCIPLNGGGSTVSGQVTFDRQKNTVNGYGSVSSAPAGLVKVSVWSTQGTQSTSDDMLLAGTETDAAGNYNVSFSSDGHKVYVTAYAWWDDDGSTHYVNIADNFGWDDGETAGVSSTSFLAQEQNAVSLHAKLSGSAGAFNILRRLQEGRAFAKQYMGSPPAVWVKWDGPNNDYCWYGSYYSPTEQYIHIAACEDDGDEFDDSVILHEYGHHVSFTLSKDNNPGGPHWVTNHVDPCMAWSEGFATFFGQAVVGDPVYIDASLNEALVFDLEAATDMCPATAYLGMKQDICEALVGGALWDIHDAQQESYDNLLMGPDEVLDVVAGYLPAPDSVDRGVVGTDFVDFLDGWFCSGYQQYSGLYNLVVTALQFPYDFSGPCGKVPNPLRLNATVLDRDGGVTLVAVETWSAIVLPEVRLTPILPEDARLLAPMDDASFALGPGDSRRIELLLEHEPDSGKLYFTASAQPHPGLHYGTTLSVALTEDLPPASPTRFGGTP